MEGQNDGTQIPEECMTFVCDGYGFESHSEQMLNCFYVDDWVGRYSPTQRKSGGNVAHQWLRTLAWHPAFCLFPIPILGLHVLVVQVAQALDHAPLPVAVTSSAAFGRGQSGSYYQEVHHHLRQAERTRGGYVSGGHCLEEGKGSDDVYTFALDLWIWNAGDALESRSTL